MRESQGNVTVGQERARARKSQGNRAGAKQPGAYKAGVKRSQGHIEQGQEKVRERELGQKKARGTQYWGKKKKAKAT